MGEWYTTRDVHDAYRDGRTDPVELAERALRLAEKQDAGDRGMEAFVALDANDVLGQARASARRWEAGEPLGLLDGVPVAIKDEFDVAGFPTGAGTRFRGDRPAAEDSEVVARLRRAGAILFGKTTMTEIGLGGTGVNPASKTPRNPWDLDRLTGGSSSGSAAAVAAGTVPVALGSDAGGSIRMPAAICGVYGLKPTYGRIASGGGELLAWSLDHLGPLGASLDDLAIFYDAVAGPGSDEPSRRQPPPEPTADLRATELEGLRLAWSPDFSHEADPDVRTAFRGALEDLREAGATVEEVELEWAEHVQRVGYMTIACEAAASQKDWLREHRDEYNLDTRLTLAVAERFTAVEYLHAQRIRRLIRDEFERVTSRFDAFLNPTLACTAPPRPRSADADGQVDTALTSKVSRFTFAGTLTGFPGLSIPLRTDDLPVGLHVMTGAWCESALFRVGRAIDPVVARRRTPAAYRTPLAATRAHARGPS